jgi:PAS domain S-box-containing protein
MNRQAFYLLVIILGLVMQGVETKAGQTLVLDRTHSAYDITPYTNYGKVNFSEINNKLIFEGNSSQKMVPLSSHPIPYDRVIPQKYLFCFELMNKTTESYWHFDIDFYPLQYITVYLTDTSNRILEKYQSGGLYPIKFGFHDNTSYSFKFKLPDQGKYKVYTVVETSTFFLFPATIQDSSSVLQQRSLRYFYILLTLGIVLAALILSLTLFFSTREIPFLFLILLILLLIVESYYQYGFGYEFCPNMSDFFKARMRIFLMVPVSLLLNIFTIRYFNLETIKHLKRIYASFNLLLVLYGFLILIGAPFFIVNVISPVLVGIVMLLNFGVGILGIIRNNKLAYWYLPGITALIISSLLLSLVLFQKVSFHPLLYHANFFGTAVFCLMQTLGMQTKISDLKVNRQKLLITQEINERLVEALNEKEKTTVLLQTKATELEREQLNSRLLTSAVESSESTIIITKQDATIVYVNPSFAKITGYEAEEAIGQKTSLLKSEFHPAEFYQDLWQTILAGKTWKGEIKNCKKNGDLYWESAVITPVMHQKLGEITHFVAVKDDITEKRHYLDRLTASEQLLREANAVKDKLFSIISHDLMNPFNALMGFSNILHENLTKIKDETNAEYAAIINESTLKMLRLLNNLLVWAGKNTGEIPLNPVLVNIHTFVAESLMLIIPFAQHKGVEMGLEQSDPEVGSLDPDLVSVILRNLLWNGLNATERGGNVRVGYSFDNHELIFWVSDTGPGISDQDSEFIFQIKTGRPKSTNLKSGTGLGLYLCKELVDFMGGRIWFENREGKGTAFYFTVPQR